MHILFTCSSGLLCALLVFLLACQNSSAQSGGVLLSATPQTLIAIGQPLEVTITVSNDTSTAWQTGGDLTYSWLAETFNASWNSNLDFALLSYATVPPGAIDTMTLIVQSSNLPVNPGTYQFAISAAYNWYTLSSVMSGSPQTVSFSIVNPPPNHPPVITPIGDRTAFEGVTLSFQVLAIDTDNPPQTLTFSLGPGAPYGANINPTNGWFSWTPLPGTAPQTNRVSVIVQDNGLVAMTATNTFNIAVTKLLRFLPPTYLGNSSMRLSWESTAGKHYRLRYRDDLTTGSWTNLGSDILATRTITSVTNAITTPSVRFYQLVLLD